MMPLKQLIPEKYCLFCQGCCRFADRNSSWVPLFLYEEIEALTRDNILPSCLFTHSLQKPGRAARIDCVEIDGLFFCPCLEADGHACKIYGHRPLDCRLYPFLLVKKNNTSYLAVDPHCPFIRDHGASADVQAYIKDLITFLTTAEFRRMMAANPEFIQEYPVDLKILASVPSF